MIAFCGVRFRRQSDDSLNVLGFVSLWGGEEAYLEAWRRALRATLDVGGTIFHHHGIGRLRASWLREELGSAYPLLLDLKRALDPSGLMYPGTLVAGN